MKKLWKATATVAAAVLLAGSLAGCGSSGGSSSSSGGGKSGSTSDMIVTTMYTEAGSLDSAGESGLWWWSYDDVCMAPIMEMKEDGSWDYILAESVDVNEDMTQYTVHLRSDAKWSNGDDVTSADFKNTIVRALDPNCKSGYSSMLYPIAGAEEMYNGTGDESGLGVDTSDDKTIVFNLKEPCAYFEQLFVLPVYMPTHRELQTETNGDWAMGNDMDALVSCGPYYLAEYVPNQYSVYKKNENYVQADRIKTDTIKKMVMDDTQSIINAYKSGELNFISADYTVMDEYKDSDELITSPAMTSYYVLFNVNEAPFDDVRVRQAFSMAVNRDEVASACGSSYEASDFFVAKHLKSSASGKDWAEEVEEDPIGFDPDKAKELLAEAGYPDGEGFPAITYKYPSLQLDSDMAQALQAQWKTNLGVEVELQAEEQQVQVAERRSGDFQLARMRWTADFTDPFTFLSMYRSNDSYNDNKTNCPEYDELMAQSNEESDPTARFELLHQAESVLVNDYCFGVPVLNSSNIYLVSTDITNFEIDPSRNMIRTKYLVLGDSSSES